MSGGGDSFSIWKARLHLLVVLVIIALLVGAVVFIIMFFLIPPSEDQSQSGGSLSVVEGKSIQVGTTLFVSDGGGEYLLQAAPGGGDVLAEAGPGDQFRILTPTIYYDEDERWWVHGSLLKDGKAIQGFLPYDVLGDIGDYTNN